jgi:hypothetical protein
MRSLLRILALATMALSASALSAHAATIIACPLQQATRTIAEPLAPGWSTSSAVSPVTDYKVDTSSGQQVLTCIYGAAGSIQRPVPITQNCTKIPGRKFSCVAAAPPGPAVVSDGPLTLSDGGNADLDAGGAPDIRLRADNPFLRTFEPMSGAKLSPQGTHVPSFADCQGAPYSPAPILQTQLPAGVWLCVRTSDGNIGRIHIVNINGVPGLPIPMTLYLDHTTWSGSPGPGPGPGPGPSQPVFSSGNVVIPQTYTVDLDKGTMGGGNNDDLWFQAVTNAQLFLKPVNGAQLAVGDGSNRGYDGCSTASFSTTAVPLGSLSTGTYVCAATGDGRVSQFRIVGITPGSPKKLTINYTTWQ